MDKNLRKRPAQIFRHAVVVLANWCQFSPGQQVLLTRVESRMFLWCEKGKGRVTVNGETIDFSPGDWIFVPWKFRMLYEADRRQPFLIAGIHLIPRHGAGPVSCSVAHHATDSLANHPGRQDVLWPALRGLVRGRFMESDRLALLATFIVDKFQSDTKKDSSMFDLAQLLVGEVHRAVERQRTGPRPLPGSLRRLQEYIRDHLREEISIETLARMAGCSSASVHRLFQDHTGLPPARYVAQMRAEKAAALLRTTLLPIAKVGEQVGLADPFHFSRHFKRRIGLSPREYQRSRRFL